MTWESGPGGPRSAKEGEQPTTGSTSMNASIPRPIRTHPARQADRADVASLNIAALVGEQGWARLPAAVRRRFQAGHADVDYAGEMELQCSFMGRCFAWCARILGSPLVGLREARVSTVVRVRHDAHGGTVWERRFHTASGHESVVRSTKLLGRDGGLVERTDGGLSMALDVYEDDGSLVFESRRFALSAGRWWLPIPALCSPGRCRVTHTDLGAGQFRFTLEMTHPWLGRTFHQTGVFSDPEGSAQ